MVVTVGILRITGVNVSIFWVKTGPIMLPTEVRTYEVVTLSRKSHLGTIHKGLVSFSSQGSYIRLLLNKVDRTLEMIKVAEGN